MAWLKEKSGAWPPVGLPPFQPRPLPSSLANGAGSLSSQASLEGVGAGGLSAAHSTDTQGSTAEEDELSRELTMELLQDMCLRAQDGAAPPMSRRSSAHPTSRRASVSLSLQPQQSEGGGSVATVDTAVHPAAVGEEEEEEELEGWRDEEEEEDLQPSLYDQLGGGVVVKVRRGGRARGRAPRRVPAVLSPPHPTLARLHAAPALPHRHTPPAQTGAGGRVLPPRAVRRAAAALFRGRGHGQAHPQVHAVCHLRAGRA